MVDIVIEVEAVVDEFVVDILDLVVSFSAMTAYLNVSINPYHSSHINVRASLIIYSGISKHKSTQ
jgi:hypothetical protein